MPRNAAPSGFPICPRFVGRFSADEVEGDEAVVLELRRKSCVIATPMEAKAREVRSHARKVRSAVRGEDRISLGS